MRVFVFNGMSTNNAVGNTPLLTHFPGYKKRALPNSDYQPINAGLPKQKAKAYQLAYQSGKQTVSLERGVGHVSYIPESGRGYCVSFSLIDVGRVSSAYV
eukprot:1137766-Pelagomonas_calceolata.AAC.3